MAGLDFNTRTGFSVSPWGVLLRYCVVVVIMLRYWREVVSFVVRSGRICLESPGLEYEIEHITRNIEYRKLKVSMDGRYNFSHCSHLQPCIALNHDVLRAPG